MFKQYITQVMLNAKTMANSLLKKGYTLVSGTEELEKTHLYKTIMRSLLLLPLKECVTQLLVDCLFVLSNPICILF